MSEARHPYDSRTALGKAACGADHSLLLTSSSALWATGRGRVVQLKQAKTGWFTKPESLSKLFLEAG